MQRATAWQVFGTSAAKLPPVGFANRISARRKEAEGKSYSECERSRTKRANWPSGGANKQTSPTSKLPELVITIIIITVIIIILPRSLSLSLDYLMRAVPRRAASIARFWALVALNFSTFKQK